MSSLDRYKHFNQLSTVIPKEMDALVLSGKGFDNLALARIPVPEPGPGQFLARVDAVFACASDGKLIELGEEHPLMAGWDPARWPVAIGHEGCITAVKVGEDLKGHIKAGNSYAVQPAINIGPINHRERYTNALALEKVAIGYTLGGLFAEYMLITEEVIRTDSLIPYDTGKVPYFAMAFSEPLSCVYSAQNQIPHIYKQGSNEPREVRLGLRRGGVTLILGAGPMGILHADLAMMYRPRAIVVSEPIVERREQAENILRAKSVERNIELTITGPDELKAVLKLVTNGHGVDDCITALGVAKIQEQSIGYLGKGGVASFFGGAKAGESVISVDTRRIHYDGIKLVGSSGGDPSDIKAVVNLLEAGEISPERYVRRVGGLDAAPGLVKSIRAQEFFGKGLIYPHVRRPLFEVGSWSFEEENAFLEKNLAG